MTAYCNIALLMTSSTFSPICANNGSVNEYVWMYVCVYTEFGCDWKEEVNGGHYKPFTLSRGRREIGSRYDQCPHCPSSFQSSFPNPSWLLHNVHQLMYWRPLAFPQATLPTNLFGRHQLTCHPIITDILVGLLGSLRWDKYLAQNLRQKLPTYKMEHPRKTKTTTTWSEAQILISSSLAYMFSVYKQESLEKADLMRFHYSPEWWWVTAKEDDMLADSLWSQTVHYLTMIYVCWNIAIR